MLQIHVETDNAAFEELPEIELAEILDKVKTRILHGERAGQIMDSNGNSVGSFELFLN
jgi:hypothetical protein